MKKAVKKEKKVVVKKAPKLVKSVAPKVPKHNHDGVKPQPKVVVSNDCPACKGIGLARPEWVGSEVCGVCNGTGKQQ